MTDATHEPDTSRPLPGVTPEQRLIDLAEAHLAACAAYVKSKDTRNRESLMYAVDDAADALAIGSNPQTIKALAEVVRAARGVAFSDDVLPKTVEEAVLHLGALEERIRALAVSIRALDSQEEQQS